jgi:hypothetical protein
MATASEHIRAGVDSERRIFARRSNRGVDVCGSWERAQGKPDADWGLGLLAWTRSSRLSPDLRVRMQVALGSVMVHGPQ